MREFTLGPLSETWSAAQGSCLLVGLAANLTIEYSCRQASDEVSANKQFIWHIREMTSSVTLAFDHSRSVRARATLVVSVHQSAKFKDYSPSQSRDMAKFLLTTAI